MPYGERPALEWSPDLGWVIASLAWCDGFDRAEAFLDAVIERATRRVALVDVAVAATWRAFGRLRQGKLVKVEADIATAAQIYGELDQADHAIVSAVRSTSSLRAAPSTRPNRYSSSGIWTPTPTSSSTWRLSTPARGCASPRDA